MPHKEILRSTEVKSREAFLLILTILMLMIINVVGVDAADEESMWKSFNETGAIELILDDTFESDLQSTVEYANNTVEQAQNQEVSFPQVNIPSGVNVRSLEASASTLSSFPRGSADVIGWFNATTADRFGQARTGIWFVVENGGQIGAVHSGLVDQADGTDLTPGELATAGVPQFTVEAGVPTAPAAPEGDGDDEAGSGDGNDDDETEVQPTEAPAGGEDLVVPEVPSSFTTRISVLEGGALVWREVTVTPNAEQIMPLPLGVVDLSLYPQYRTFADQIEAGMQGGNRTTMEALRSMGVHAIYVGSTPDGDALSHYFAIPRADGSWATFSVGSRGSLALLPVDGSLNPVDSGFATNLTITDGATRMGSENRLTVAGDTVLPGDSAVVFVYLSRDPETGEQDQGPWAQGVRVMCDNRDTDEIFEFILESEDNVCVLGNGMEIAPRFSRTGISAPNQ